MPGRSFQPSIIDEYNRWATGLAAWDNLFLDEEWSKSLLDWTNEWLSPEGLDTGYQCESVVLKNVPVTRKFSLLISKGIDEDDIDDIQYEYENLTTIKRVYLREIKNNILLNPIDVGIGISQINPSSRFMFSSLQGTSSDRTTRITFHPRVQCELADLFIETMWFTEEYLDSYPRTYLIETHSEHLLLRLKRRIRERFEKICLQANQV